LGDQETIKEDSLDNFLPQGDDNWYSSDDEEGRHDSKRYQDRVPVTSQNEMFLPMELTEVLSSIKKEGRAETLPHLSSTDDPQNCRDPRFFFNFQDFSLKLLQLK